MSWERKNDYYIENNGWTITRYGGYGLSYGLWKGNTSMGYFKSSQEAKNEFERLKKNDLLHNV